MIAAGLDDLLADGISIDMCNDSIAVTVGELDWEGFESVTFGHIVLDSMLELNSGKVTATDSLKFVVC